ncbi:DegV family protein [Actinoplanes sp. NPDC051494]|uniref:DegV family protein n=1 Tax=Actinoplanes sp. NPDC051494 TaxID=3363907 RepID=UPI0037919F6A
MAVAVVTDSTAYLPAELHGTYDLTVVPLTVVINGDEGREGEEMFPGEVARALRTRRAAVSTSRPAPSQFVAAYTELLDAGADGIVSVHLSSKLSGTYDAAMLAAAEIGPRIQVVDSGTTGMGLGFAALAAAAAARDNQDLPSVRAEAAAHASQVSTLFYVDTLEFLRRGGRMGAASALLGTALAVKPILHVLDGAIVVRDKVRTAGRALARLVDLAVEASGTGEVDIAVHHLEAADRAGALADAVSMRLGDRLRDCYITEIGAVVAAHVGPGAAGVVVHRRS